MIKIFLGFLVFAAAIVAAVGFFGYSALSSAVARGTDCEKKGGVPVSIHGQTVCFAKDAIIK